MSKPPPPTVMISAALIEVAALKLVLRAVVESVLPDEEVARRDQLERLTRRIEQLAILAQSPGLDDAFGGRLNAQARKVAVSFVADLGRRGMGH